jgi:DNA-directed RNA polymerase subunit M/transcription elongation factor TFIIS
MTSWTHAIRTHVPDVDEKTAVAIHDACVRRAAEFSASRSFTCNWKNPRFVKAYLNIRRNVVVALTKRDDIRSKVVNGAMDADALLSVPPHDMFPEEWGACVTEHERRMRHAYEKRVQAKTTAYRCPKCKNTNCDFNDLQLRSADESMTTFVQCLTCGFGWRLN